MLHGAAEKGKNRCPRFKRMSFCVCARVSVGGLVGFSIYWLSTSLSLPANSVYSSEMVHQFLRWATCLLSLSIANRGGLSASVPSSSGSPDFYLARPDIFPNHEGVASALRRRDAAEETSVELVMLRNEAGECLGMEKYDLGTPLAWQSCHLTDFAIFRNFTNGSKGRIEGRLGDICLTLLPVDGGEGASLQMLKCSEDKNDPSQSWELRQSEDGSTQIRTLAESPDALCISVKGAEHGGKRTAEMLPCARGYKVEIAQIDMFKIFRAAEAKTSIRFIVQVRYGRILEGRNDRTAKMPAKYPLHDIIQACAEECLSFRCKNYEVLYDKNVCHFSINSYGGVGDTIPYPWGVVYFDRLLG